MGALLHPKLYESRGWNRSTIPTKVYLGYSNEQVLPDKLIQIENQTITATKLYYVSTQREIFNLNFNRKTTNHEPLNDKPYVNYENYSEVNLPTNSIINENYSEVNLPTNSIINNNNDHSNNNNDHSNSNSNSAFKQSNMLLFFLFYGFIGITPIYIMAEFNRYIENNITHKNSFMLHNDNLASFYSHWLPKDFSKPRLDNQVLTKTMRDINNRDYLQKYLDGFADITLHSDLPISTTAKYNFIFANAAGITKGELYSKIIIENADSYIRNGRNMQGFSRATKDEFINQLEQIRHGGGMFSLMRVNSRIKDVFYRDYGITHDIHFMELVKRANSANMKANICMDNILGKLQANEELNHIERIIHQAEQFGSNHYPIKNQIETLYDIMSKERFYSGASINTSFRNTDDFCNLGKSFWGQSETPSVSPYIEAIMKEFSVSSKYPYNLYYNRLYYDRNPANVIVPEVEEEGYDAKWIAEQKARYNAKHNIQSYTEGFSFQEDSFKFSSAEFIALIDGIIQHYEAFFISGISVIFDPLQEFLRFYTSIHVCDGIFLHEVISVCIQCGLLMLLLEEHDRLCWRYPIYCRVSNYFVNLIWVLINFFISKILIKLIRLFIILLVPLIIALTLKLCFFIGIAGLLLILKWLFISLFVMFHIYAIFGMAKVYLDIILGCMGFDFTPQRGYFKIKK